jgi:hypothetical protein
VSAAGQDAQPIKNSYAPVDDKESFATVHGRMVAAKAGIMKRQMDLLEERYDLSDHPASGVVMDRTKPVQEGCEGLRLLLPHSDVTFHKYGDTEYLNRIWVEGQRYGMKVDPTKAETKAAANANVVEHSLSASLR